MIMRDLQMMKFCRWALKKIKLTVLYFTRIVFVKNNFKVSVFNKLRSNIFGGFLADQYVLYDLKHNDKKEYLSEFDWYRSRYINEPFDFALNNKVICSEMLQGYIRIPQNYFIKNRGVFHDFATGPAEKGAIYSCLKEEGRLFMKPFALGKGNGIHLLEYSDEKVSIDGMRVSKENFFEFLEKNQDYIICEYMKQHRYAEEIYDRTVNTIRLITLRDTETHRFKIFFEVQRIGRRETIPVDNGSKGGLIAKIDLDTGILSEARCLHDLNEYVVHPDSGNAIKGVKVPRWEQVQEEILDVCRKIPYMDFIAWDLLVIEDGICMIEANTSSGVNILQLWGGQRQRELGEFFRYYGVIRK